MQEVRSFRKKEPRAWSALCVARHDSQTADKGLTRASIQLPEKRVSVTEFLGERPEQMASPSLHPDPSDASTMQLIPAATSWLPRSFIHHPLGGWPLGPAHLPSSMLLHVGRGPLLAAMVLSACNNRVSFFACATKASLSSSGERQPCSSNHY